MYPTQHAGPAPQIMHDKPSLSHTLKSYTGTGTCFSDKVHCATQVGTDFEQHLAIQVLKNGENNNGCGPTKLYGKFVLDACGCELMQLPPTEKTDTVGQRCLRFGSTPCYVVAAPCNIASATVKAGKIAKVTQNHSHQAMVDQHSTKDQFTSKLLKRPSSGVCFTDQFCCTNKIVTDFQQTHARNVLENPELNKGCGLGKSYASFVTGAALCQLSKLPPTPETDTDSQRCSRFALVPWYVATAPCEIPMAAWKAGRIADAMKSPDHVTMT